MIYKLIFIFILLNISACSLKQKKTQEWDMVECYRDWDEIENKRVLSILAENSPASFFIYKGKNMGYEYELLHEFSKDMGIELKVFMMHNLDSMFLALKQCKGDLIACNLTITPEREQEVKFTNPHLITHQVLIQKKPKNWRKLSKKNLQDSLINTIEELKNKTIFVWQNSTYFKQINEINRKLNLNMAIIPVEGDITSEELIEMVNNEEIEYTITDANVAQINQIYYPDIDISMRVSDEQSIAFAGRKSSTKLIDTLNYWLNDKKNKSTIGEVKRKYFKRKTHINKAIGDYSTVTSKGQLSPYDEIIKKESQRIGWDWRLISAIIYQESKFETWKKSWAGAFGIFQFMPSTAVAYGISPNSSAEAQIKAGITKLSKNYKRWLRDLNDSTEAIYFTLATFNAGRGHIDDAIALTKKYGKNPNKWFDNVNEMMLNLSNPKYYRDKVVKLGYMRGKETYNYVTEIMNRYEEYKHAFPDEKSYN
ncbi:MAG TPA: transporter substrate-binding domain-containing protein [Crocinitomix sp.]|nr:transporter substrate-binding domain-containing protein [Crocinitomix sp.]